MLREPFGLQRHPVFRTGIVQAQDAATGRVRVQFPDRDNVISWWLHVIRAGTQDDKDWWMPDIGEQVAVLMDEHDEDGAVVGAIYSKPDAPPSWAATGVRGFQASDGAIVTYDRTTHVLTAQLPSGAAVNVSTGQGSEILLGADGTATVEDKAGAYVKLTADGNVHVNGNLLVAGTISTTAGTWGDGHGTITGSLSATGEITAGQGGGDSVGLQTHTHPDPQGGNTGVPNAGT